MDTLSAILMGQANRCQPLMVFDWDSAARILRMKNAKEASAGLRSDWEYTEAKILENGIPVKDSTGYLSSTWAVPELDVSGEIIECWKYADDTDGWDEKTWWPESSTKIYGTEATRNADATVP